MINTGPMNKKNYNKHKIKQETGRDKCPEHRTDHDIG